MISLERLKEELLIYKASNFFHWPIKINPIVEGTMCLIFSELDYIEKAVYVVSKTEIGSVWYITFSSALKSDYSQLPLVPFNEATPSLFKIHNNKYLLGIESRVS